MLRPRTILQLAKPCEPKWSLFSKRFLACKEMETTLSNFLRNSTIKCQSKMLLTQISTLIRSICTFPLAKLVFRVLIGSLRALYQVVFIVLSKRAQRFMNVLDQEKYL